MSGPIALTVSGRNRALSQVADQHAKALALADLNPFAQQDTAAHHAVFFAPHRGDRNAEARELFLRGPPRVYRAGFVVAVKRQQRGYRERSQPCTRKSARTRHEISELRLGVRNSQESRNRPAWFRSLGATPDGECPACAANCDFLGRHSLRRDQNGSSFFVHEIPLFAPAARDVQASAGRPYLGGVRRASTRSRSNATPPPRFVAKPGILARCTAARCAAIASTAARCNARRGVTTWNDSETARCESLNTSSRSRNASRAK